MGRVQCSCITNLRGKEIMTDQETAEAVLQHIQRLADEMSIAKKYYDLVRSRGSHKGLPSEEHEQELSLNGENPAYGQIARDVRSAIERTLKADFTLEDINRTLVLMGKRIDRPALARCVTRLLIGKRPIIKVIKKGAGRTPAKIVQT